MNQITTRHATTGLVAVIVTVDGLAWIFPGYLSDLDALAAGRRFAEALTPAPPRAPRHPERRGKAHDARRRERSFVQGRKAHLMNLYAQGIRS